MKAICVYCGSSSGNQAAYTEAAKQLASEMVKDDITLVYGGGNVGLMGVIADEVMHLGGKAIGVIPTALLDKEVGHHGLSHLHVVKDMHERKAMMARLSDGFIAMPGGIGTLEELFESFTWLQLGLHTKPIGLLNVNGFYDGLIDFIGHTVAQGFLKARHAALLMSETDPASLLARFKNFVPSEQPAALDWQTAQSLLS
jgi:uncharacterized protein (TIGR00730 family)